MRKLDINNRRYLGSKYKLLNFIEKTVNENCNDIKSVIDVFANNAEAMFNAVVFPEKISGAIQLRAEGGTAILEKIQIYSF